MIDEALYSLLTGDSGVSSYVGNRVYPGHLPQSETLPAIAFFRVDGSGRTVSHSGASSVAGGIFQISCLALTSLEAKHVAEAVRRKMHGFSGTVGSEKIYLARLINEVDLFDPDLPEYHVALDFELTYEET